MMDKANSEAFVCVGIGNAVMPCGEEAMRPFGRRELVPESII